MFADLSEIVLELLTTAMLVNQCENDECNKFTILLDTCIVDSIQLHKKSSQNKMCEEIFFASQQICLYLIELFASTKSKFSFSYSFEIVIIFLCFFHIFRKTKAMETCK